MRHHLIRIAMACFATMGLQAQDSTLLMFSKMDLNPQFTLWDGTQTRLMGYTFQMMTPIDLPSPKLTLTEGDSIELQLRNMSQAAPHTIHLHGLDVNQANDGVPMLSFQVDHDSTRSYHFRAPHPGTYIYHCHVISPLHVQAGMYGLVIVKPDDTLTTWQGGYSFHHDRAWMTSEIDTVWHSPAMINHLNHNSGGSHILPSFNPQYFLINGKSEQQLDATDVEIEMAVGELTYLRLANIGNDGNHFYFPPGLEATCISSDGRPLPTAFVTDSITVLPGERFGVLLEASAEWVDSVEVQYFNLNTGMIRGQQFAKVVIDGFIGLDESDFHRLIISPNPSNGTVVIKHDHPLGTVQIINVEGRFVNAYELGETTEATLNLEHLPAGVYALRSRHGTQRFVIRH